MILRFDTDGSALTVYGEAIDLTDLGRVAISRASHVEPTADGTWEANLAPVGGPKLGPYARRTEAINAEIAWLENWIMKGRNR